MRPRPSWNWLVATFLAAFIFPFGPEAQANLSDLPPAKLTASAGADITGFGISVGVSGDTVVVGASSFVSTTERSAHVFVRPAAGWNGALTESARLTMPGGSSDSGFGQSVAVSGDMIVVGAPGAENGKGAAYVFVKPAGGWSQSPVPSAMLTAFPDPTTPQRAFGHLVAVDGDTIVVSPDASAGQGTVYVFVKPVGGWRDATENAKLAQTSRPASFSAAAYRWTVTP
jgi:FG-GAP repeat